MKTIIGVFDHQKDAENAIHNLKNEGFEPSDISVIMKDTPPTTTHIQFPNPLARVAFPGLGYFSISGPLAAALGLTGIPDATNSVADGLSGALAGLGLSDKQNQHYEKQLSEGGILLAVPAMDMDETDVHEIFTTHHAADITVIGNPTTETTTEEYGYLEADVYSSRPVYAPVGTKGGKTKKSTAKKPKSHHSRPHKKAVK